MTQSNEDDSFTIDISDLKLDDILDTTGDITIDLGNYDAQTTTYWAGDSVTDITLSSSDNTFTLNDTITINTGSGITDTVDFDWIYNNTSIDPSKVERMCKQYPALEKVWRNFKSVYDMCKQDYEGKKKAGEIDDDELPF